MKNKFVLVLLLVSLGLNAQDNIFKVLATKSCYIKNDSEWKLLKGGGEINNDDVLKIKGDGYLALLHKTGVHLEIDKSGEYTSKELLEKVSSYTASFTKRFAKFAVNKMLEDKDLVADMSVTGAVTRGGVFDKSIKEPIHLFSLDEIRIIKNRTIPLKWVSVDNSSPYLVRLLDLNENELFVRESVTESIRLDFSTIDLQENEKYILIISSVKKPDLAAAKCIVRVFPSKDADVIEKELRMIENELDRKSAFDNMIYAAFFEEKGMITDAVDSYEKALVIAGGVKDYRNAYNVFLKRNGLENPK